MDANFLSWKKLPCYSILEWYISVEHKGYNFCIIVMTETFEQSHKEKKVLVNRIFMFSHGAFVS